MNRLLILTIIVQLLLTACAKFENQQAENDFKTLMIGSSQKLTAKNQFLENNVFQGLTNLNSGFDAESIKYFSEDEFEIVLQRVKELKLGITGIEPWKDGEFYNVLTYEMFTEDPSDPNWYMKAFEDFKSDGVSLQYSASYSVPDSLLIK